MWKSADNFILNLIPDGVSEDEFEGMEMDMVDEMRWGKFVWLIQQIPKY